MTEEAQNRPDPTCGRCHTPLKFVRVKVPVYLDRLTPDGESEKVLLRYDEEDQVSDCPRCTGGY